MSHPAVKIRNTIIAEGGFVLKKVFDTNEHEPDKDVCVIELEDGIEAVLRVGERRPETFFPEGYRGEHFVIPRLITSSNDPVYEIEEYLGGFEIEEVDPAPLSDSIVRSDLQTKLLKAFWELQSSFTTQGLEDAERKTHKHLESAIELIPKDLHNEFREVLARNEAFFLELFPSKWKYSKDNILLLDDGRLGLIDLVNVGNRFWGYDIGWLYWPQWFHFSIEQYRDAEGYLEKIDALHAELYNLAPEGEKADRSIFMHRCNMVLITRIVGGLHDVASSISHARNLMANKERRDAFERFLVEMLRVVVGRL